MVIQRQNVLGVQISAVNMPQAIEIIELWIKNGDPNYICVTPAHGVMECQHSPELQQIFNQSGLTTPDGMSIVWLLRLLGHKNVRRVYGPDLLQEICSVSKDKGYKHFFYGGAPGIPEQLATKLIEQFPGLNVVGTYSPPYRSLTTNEDAQIIQMINKSGADIVWVGISTPKQEIWMHEHLGKLKPPVLIGVGAAFDFLSGNKKQAPKWIQKSGFEWFFRLANEPTRLWKRYIQYPLFIILVLAQILGISKYD